MKNPRELFESLFCMVRIVVDWEIYNIKQKKNVRPVTDLKSCQNSHFTLHNLKYIEILT